jgi:hypothetical protein
MTDPRQRRRLTTLTDADNYSNRDLLLDIALKLHEHGMALGSVQSDVKTHLAMHAVLNRLLTVAFPSIVGALVALYLRR